MRRPLALLALLALPMAAHPAPAPTRRPLSGPEARGWSLVTLDAEAQRQWSSLWISDEAGRSVPFLEVRRGHVDTPPLVPGDLRLGLTPKGLPTAAFRLPPGPHRLRLGVAPVDLPWVARLLLEREGPGGTWITWAPAPRPHAWQLRGMEGLEVGLPDEPGPWRLTLVPVVGRAPRLTALRVHPQSRTWTLPGEATLPLVPVAEGAGTWRLSLPPGERLQRLEVRLHPPAAPLVATLLEPQPDRDGRPTPPRPLAHTGGLWALPGLESEGTTLQMATPFQGRDLLLRLPEGAEPAAVDALCARASLAFPAEPEHRYFLHAGAAVKPAPGDLSGLAAGFDPDRATRRTLGASEPDPQALLAETPEPSLWERSKDLWPWAIGALTLGLAWAAFGLLKPRG